jgi:hypothetical protein
MGPYRNNARRRQRRGGVDYADPAMRTGRAHDPHVYLVREREVGDKAPAPGQKRRIFEPENRLAD